MSSDMSWLAQPLHRIAIIGVGQVGGAAAYALILSSIAKELLLVDIDIDLREGQVQDLSDAAYSTNRGTSVRKATYQEASQCDIVVLTAGSKYMLGQTTIDRIYRNVSIVRNVLDAMTPFRSDTILVVVSNPCDLLTSLARELSGLPASQVLGAGTFLDSVRLRGLIADKTSVAANSIHINAVGVQGPSEVIAWSTATIGGIPVQGWYGPECAIECTDLEDECHARSQCIIRSKGSIPYGMGSIICSICTSILLDRRNIRPISHFQPDYDCCLSLPAVLGRKGILSTVKVPLTSEEEAEIANSAAEVARLLDRIRNNEEARNGGNRG